MTRCNLLLDLFQRNSKPLDKIIVIVKGAITNSEKKSIKNGGTITTYSKLSVKVILIQLIEVITSLILIKLISLGYGMKYIIEIRHN